MSGKVMGTPADMLTPGAAAKLLKVTTRTLNNYVSQGLLQAVYEQRRCFFRRADVIALAEVFNEGNDLAAVATTAIRALIRAEQCEKRLNELLSLLGFTTVSLVTTEPGILELYHRAIRMHSNEEPIVIAAQVFQFAKELLAFNEEYLRLVEHHTGDDEPWRVYLVACEKLTALTPFDRMVHDLELSTAYSYVVAARRHIRSVAYFYVRARHGAAVADEAFIGANAFEPIITTLFPN